MHLFVLCLQAQVSDCFVARLCSPLGDGGCPAAANERSGLGRDGGREGGGTVKNPGDKSRPAVKSRDRGGSPPGCEIRCGELGLRVLWSTLDFKDLYWVIFKLP